MGKIDICLSIQKICNINCPLIVDDIESLDSENVSNIIKKIKSQVIMLAVSDGDMEILEIKND